MIRHNIGYKLLALAIAMIIWAYASAEHRPHAANELKLPLEVKVDAGYAVTKPPKFVMVRVEGRKGHVESVVAQPDELVAWVDLRGRRVPGSHRVPVLVKLPEGYAGLVTTTVVPREVPITLTARAERVLKIDVEFAVPPPAGFRFGTLEITPAEVAVSGMAARVNRVGRLVVAVQPRMVGSSGVDGDCLVSARDGSGREVHGIDLTPERVHVRLGLEKLPASRVVFVSPTVVGRPAFPHTVSRIDVQPETVTLTGDPRRLTGVAMVQTQELDLEGRTETFTERLSVVVPPGTTLAGGRQVRVTVSISSPKQDRSHNESGQDR